ncbi:NDR1/HIN1-like protein [Thalictrum thalictroides]|uniref:NDR1/HIN1-like protein n=1 Tax=Thalictrum thalictroides TaxID=46969 RepID=A0A7J6V0W4_THATH|nr:NDR1/HIN1-like protein [Thalictrum thalictroides]
MGEQAQRSYHSHGGRGRGCGPCCFLGFLCKLIVSIVVLIGILVLVLWLVYRPSAIKVHVVNASLREFNLTDNNNNQIRYNLAVDMSVRNTNRKIGVYYDRIQAEAFYDGVWFASTEIDTFFQGRKNTTMINPVFQGTSTILLSGPDMLKFHNERNDGTFTIDVRLNLRIRFKVGDVKTKRLKPNVYCDVRVPLTSNRTSADAFNTKRCIFDF